MIVRWTRPAVRDLEQITRYIKRDSQTAADRIAIKIYTACGELDTLSERGRQGKRHGTRELVLSPLPYVVVYRTNGSVLEILRI